MRFKVAVRGSVSAGEERPRSPAAVTESRRVLAVQKKCTQSPALSEIVRVRLQKHACQTAKGNLASAGLVM
jgi:hypothetical protein